MGRPREANPSKWACWKRNQRSSPGGKTGSGKCARCGKTMPLVNHHKDANKRNNSRSNLSRICRACHAQVDAKVIHTKVAGRVNAT